MTTVRDSDLCQAKMPWGTGGEVWDAVALSWHRAGLEGDYAGCQWCRLAAVRVLDHNCEIGSAGR